MNGAQPLLSYVLPNYNHAHMLPRALKGIFLQRYQNWEVIIADDASTDNSREVIEKFAAQDFRIKPLLSNQNRGVFGNLNFGLKAIQGDYFVSGAADDFFSSPDFFSDAIEAFTEYPEAGVFSGFARMVSEGDFKEHSIFGRAPGDGFYPGRELLRCYLSNELDIHGAACVIRADEAKQTGFDPALGPTADCALFVSTAAKLGLVYRRKVYIHVTQTAGNYSKSISLKHHSLYEKRLKESIPYAHEMEREFYNWRFAKLALFLSAPLATLLPEHPNLVFTIVRDLMVFYPGEVARRSPKESLLLLSSWLRERVRDESLQAQVPQMARIIDMVLRPYYRPEDSA